MKGIIGSCLFIVGLGVITSEAIKHQNNSIPWWIFIIAAGLILYGLDLLIDDKVEIAKKEMVEKMEGIRN